MKLRSKMTFKIYLTIKDIKTVHYKYPKNMVKPRDLLENKDSFSPLLIFQLKFVRAVNGFY